MYRETSREAYMDIVESGVLPKCERILFRLLCEHFSEEEGITSGELIKLHDRLHPEALRLRTNIRARLTGLKDSGSIRELKRRVCKESGHRVIAWVPTGDSPSKPVRKSKHLDLSTEELAVLRALYNKGTTAEQVALRRVVYHAQGRVAPPARKIP